MNSPAVTVVRTGTANLASVLAALRRVDAAPLLSDAADQVADAPFVVLPGVGSLAAAMESLRRADLVAPLVERVRAGRPTLAICLGLQLFGETSEESPDERGLGVLPMRAERFRGDVRVPHLGWNRVEPDGACELLRPGHAYFANSYRIADPPDGWGIARTDYGGEFVAALERDGVLACQFHPELSGAWGLELIARWLRKGGASC